MNRRRRTLPPVPPKAPSELRPLIAAMTEILETGEGVRGDPLDRKLTLRDILDSGIGRLKPGMRPGQDGNLDSGALPPAPDLSIPPAPANFDAQGGFYGMINLSWTIPGQQYRNHAYTNIFRSEEDNFANAEVIGREAGGFYTDYVRDDAVDPDDPTKLKGYYYWITFTSVVDIEGPPNSPNGTYAAPLADVGYVLELLTGEIDAGVLATELRQEIEKIPAIESNIERLDPIETAIERIPAIETNIERIGPIETAIERLDPIETAIERIGPIEAELRGPESLDGTVANRIAAERDARIQAVDDERAERVDSLLAEQEARQDAISFEAQARQDAIQAEVQDRVAAVAAERDARVAALQAEQGARAAAITSVEEQLVDGDTALASQLTTLTSVVDGNSADISNEQQARVSGDEALASDITTLQVQVGDNEATIINESQARIENDALRASQLAVIAATYNANTASIYSLEEIRIGDREATATRINGLDVQVEDNEASIFQEQIARANADSALASQLSVLSAKIDALPTFANGFESGLEFDRWVAASGHSITAETNDAFSGDQSALIGSTTSSVATGVAPFAVSARIPNGTADAFAGRRVRVGIAARAVSGGSAEFAIGYATSDGWFSGWHRHEPAAGWGIFEAQVEVPEVANEDHYVVVWGDTSGGGGSVEVDRLLIDVADTEIPEITAQIETLQQAIADNQQAMATQFNALGSQFDTSIATVNGELTALSTADEALASSIQTLQAEIGDNAAAIVDEQTARASETDALAQQLNAVDARVDQSRALITSEAQSRADEDSALAQQINAVDARVDGSRSLITSEQQARADGDSALASDIQTLTAVTGDLAADIQNESTVRATADEALAEDVTDLWAGVGENEARITDEARVRATEDDLLAAVQRVISASRGTASATFYSLDEVRLADSAATALRIDGVEVQLGDAFSAIELEQSLRASEDQALATQITTAVAELDGDISTVQQTLSTEVTRLDGRVDATAQAVTAVQSQLDDDIATVQQSFDTEVSRIDGQLQTNAQAITDVQASTNNALAGVQQDFNAQTSYLDGRITTETSALKDEQAVVAAAYKANAQAITTVQAGMENNLAVVQQDFNLEVTRLDGRVDSTAQALTGVQSQLSGDISTVQQNLNTNVNRIDGNVSANAQAITDVQAATDDALAGVQQDFNTEVVRLDGRVDVTAQAVTEVRSDLEGDVAGVQQNLNTNVSRLDGRIDSQAQALTTVQSDLDSDISTVQQNLNTNVNRIDDDLSANAQAITDVQAATDDALAGVQQNFNTEISRVDGRIDTAAQAVTEVRADMEEGVAGALTAIDAAVAGNDLLKNGLFSTGDFTGWAPDWSSIAVVQRNEDAGSSALQSMPTEFAARFWDSGWGANRRLRSEPQTVSVGDIYTISLDYATGGGSRDVPFGIWLGFRAAGDQWDYTNIGNFRASSTSWSKTPYYTVTIPDGITQARISVSRQAGGSGEFYVTNLRAYRIDDAMAQSITTVQSQLSGDISTVQQDVNTQVQRIDGNVSANAQAITDVQSATDDALAGVQQDFNTEVARLDGRVDVAAQAVTEVRSDLEGDVAGIQQNLNTNVSRLDGRIDSTAQSISTVQSQLSGDISTVQQNLNTNVSRIDDELDANAQAITDVQSATDDALAGVQQDFNTEIARVDDAIDANANAITEVRSDLGSDIATVQQSLTSNVNRIDGNVASNAQAITTAQSQLNGQISTVQQNLSSEINRVDGEIEATAQLVQSVQTDLGAGLNAVEIKAITNAGGILSNGQFGTGDLAGWGNTWSGVNVIEANPDGSSSAIRGAPTKYIAQWSDSAWDSQQYMRGEHFAAIAGETYTFQFAYASGGSGRNIDVQLRVAWVSADGTNSYQTLRNQNVSSTGWDKTPLLSAVAPDETVEAWVYFRRLSGGSGTLFLADVQASRTDMVAGALYTAKVQSGGLIGGFGIYNDGTEVDAGFDVDRFWLGRTNSNKRKPFIMDGDVVYINNAMIRNGSIQEGQLGPITIGKFFLDDGTPVTTAGGLIRAEAIDVDNLSVAEAARFYDDVQSGNYIAGQSGWRIRQNGSVEFNDGQFNGTVNVGNVSGAGALASKNSLSYSEVRGTKPPTNADRTASNTAADTAKVDGEDASAVRNWASSTFGRVFDNWTRPGSTEIWGNRISTADAYVDTLVIKGNAVTIPVSAAAGSEFQLQRFMREILSCSIDAKGSNVMVMASFSVGDGGITSVQIRRNGVTVLQRAVVGRFFSIAGHVGATSGGVDTYTMWASGGGIAGGRSLGLLATRR